MIDFHLECLRIRGYTILEDVLNPEQVEETRRRLDQLLELEIQRSGKEYLLQIRELGTLRFMMANDHYFLDLINLRPVMDIIERLLGEACILHLQNGIVLLPTEQHQQAAYHQDYRRWMGGHDVSFNAFFMIDDFTLENGATYVVPGTHLHEKPPTQEYMDKFAERAIARAGSVLLFNSRTWHKGGVNTTNKARRAINHQYTYSYIRQQVDYAHCLPEDEYKTLPERIQQLMGRFVRLPKDIDEFRLPGEQRLHRSGQG